MREWSGENRGKGRKERGLPVSSDSGGVQRLGTEKNSQYSPFKRADGSSSSASSFSIGFQCKNLTFLTSSLLKGLRIARVSFW